MEENIVAGIDIGGTSVKLGLFRCDTTKRLLPAVETKGTDDALIEKWSIDSKKNYSGEMLIEEIASSVKTKIKELSIDDKRLVAAGMGVPGSVDETGIVTYAPNVGWKMFDAAGELSGKLNIPVAVQNDANTAAYGELKCGSGRGKSSICFITLGTGVGGGIVVNDKIITGFNGCGGEIGHMTVNPYEKIPCNCKRYGCLEQYASATGIARMARKFMEKDEDSCSALFTYENVTAKEVFDCVKSGDSLAKKIAEKFGAVLGMALSNIACLFNPQIFAIGGGVSNAGDILVQYIQKYFVQYAYADCKKTEFSIASLGNDAGIYGGACLAISLLQ